MRTDLETASLRYLVKETASPKRRSALAALRKSTTSPEIILAISFRMRYPGNSIPYAAE